MDLPYLFSEQIRRLWLDVRERHYVLNSAPSSILSILLLRGPNTVLAAVFAGELACLRNA